MTSVSKCPRDSPSKSRVGMGGDGSSSGVLAVRPRPATHDRQQASPDDDSTSPTAAATVSGSRTPDDGKAPEWATSCALSAQWGSNVRSRGEVGHSSEERLGCGFPNRGDSDGSGLSRLPSPPLSCIVAVEEATVPPDELESKAPEGRAGRVGVIRKATTKNRSSAEKVIHFRETNSEVGFPIADDWEAEAGSLRKREKSPTGPCTPCPESDDDEDEHRPYSRMESEYRDFNVRRMPVRLLIMLPILSAIYVVSYVTARQFCPSCYLAPAFEGEIAVSISFLALATLGAHLYFLYEHLELFIAVLLCLIGTYRASMRVATLAHALENQESFLVVFPYYGANGMLENYLLCFTMVTFLGMRFGYALWATLYMLCLVVPITGLSLRFSAVTLMGESRVWIAWGSMLHALLILLLVLTLVSSYYEERKKRILFWNLKNSDARLECLEQQVTHKRGSRKPMIGTPFECLLVILTEAQDELKRQSSVNRDQVLTLLQEAQHILTTSENVYQIRAEYLDNEFTRSYLRDLRMQSHDQSDWAVSRLNTLATRRRSVLTDIRSQDELNDLGCVWDFDTHGLKEKMPRPLVDAGFLLLSPFAVSPDVSINPQVLRKFLIEVEKAYKPNPYHNSTHGITVCHLSICLLDMLHLREAVGDLEEVGLIIASLCHDIAHPGRNNNFMVNASTPLALTYNDISVLENMHASLTFRLLCDRRLNLLGHLHREAFRTCRKLMIDLILSTDMKTHFDQIANFRLRRQSDGFDPVNNDEDRQRLLELVIKSADIGHGTLPWPSHEQWCLLVVQEFYDQGDEEKRLGLPISFLCDRSQHDTEFFKSQIGFLDFVVKPLYEELEAVEEVLDQGPDRPIKAICLHNLANNIAQWKAKEEQRRLAAGDYSNVAEKEAGELPK